MPLTRRLFCAASGAALCGCAGGAVTPLPGLPDGALARAAAEIGDLPPPPRRTLADGEVTRVLDRIGRRLEPQAQGLCRELAAGSCDWWVGAGRSREMNASAARSGRVTINRGIFEFARSEEEVALVVAHELSHQIAGHPARGAADAEAGAAIGAVLGGLLVVVGAAAGARPGPARDRRTVEGMAGSGARLGRLAYGKDQEREADRLGALLLWRTGYELGRARGFLITMARASARRETGLFDTHPAGPERLAAFDATWAELRATGALPPGVG